MSPSFHCISPYLFALAVTGLSFAACDHAKDLVEQGKKQAEDIQKSIEGKTEEAATTSTSDASLPPPVATVPAPATAPGTTPAISPAVPAEKDYGQLVEQFMKAVPNQKTDQMLQELGAIPEGFRARLTECDLTGSQVTDVGLAEVAKFPNLITMNLTHCLGITDNGIAGVKDLTSLEVLRLDRTKISNIGMMHLRNLTHLKVLSLSQTAVTDAGIAKLEELSQLEELYLTATAIDGSGLRKVRIGNSLRILRADDSLFGIAGMGGLGAHKNLEEIDLTRAKVNDKTVTSIKGLSKLRILKLNHNLLSDPGVKQLTGLISLEELMLGGTSVTDNCLTAFKVCKSLRRFDVRLTAITGSGRAKILKIAPNCTFDIE